MSNEPIQTAIPETVAFMPRPKRNTLENYRAAVDKLLPEVWRWLEAANSAEWRARIDVEAEKAGVTNDLMEAVTSCTCEEDGYRLCSYLEHHHHWDCDFTLAEILDDFSGALDNIYRNAVERWIKETGVGPQHDVADVVTVKTRRDFKTPPEEFTGIVESIDQRRGTYTVYIPALGHLRGEDARRQLGKTGSVTTGQVFHWEDVDGGLFPRKVPAAERPTSITMDGVNLPWCEACRSYHHPDNPTCFLRVGLGDPTAPPPALYTSLRLTDHEREMIRHAVGLDGRYKTTYRNHFVCNAPDRDHEAWTGLVSRGLARVMKGKILGELSGGMDCFCATRAAVLAVLKPDEKLAEDFKE
jgi:hypothetical protein